MDRLPGSEPIAACVLGPALEPDPEPEPQPESRTAPLNSPADFRNSPRSIRRITKILQVGAGWLTVQRLRRGSKVRLVTQSTTRRRVLLTLAAVVLLAAVAAVAFQTIGHVASRAAPPLPAV